MSGASRDSPGFIAVVQASAGAVGGVFAAFVLMPLEVAKTRIQLSHSGDASTFGTVVAIMRAEGLSGLFRGVTAKCSETGSKNFVYFYIYDAINAMVKRRMELTTSVKLGLGYVAGVGTTIATMPLEVMATKIQAETSGEGLFTLMQRVVQREGVSGLFKGFWYNILLCINPAIQNTVFDRIKDTLLATRKAGGLSPFEAFALGALAKAIATLVTYPMVRLKTILQAGQDLDAKAVKARAEPATRAKGPQRSSSTGELLSVLSVREDFPTAMQGLVSRAIELYRGIGSALMKSVLQAALLYMTKDQVADAVRIFFKLSARAFFRKNGMLKLGAISGRPLAS